MNWLRSALQAFKQFQPLNKALIVLGAVVGLGGVIALATPGQGQDQKAGPPPVPIETIRAERRDVPHVVEAVGTVQSLQAVTARTQVDGILTQILFREGDRVTRGQLLATIDDRTLKATLAGASAQLARDRAQLRLAELDLERYRNLLDRNAIARQTVDQQRAQVDELRAAIALDQANVDAARVNLSYTRIVAPVSGRVGIRQVDQGNIVRVGDAGGIVTVAQVDPISIVFPVPQSVLSQLKSNSGKAGARIVEAVDRETRQSLGRGEITAIDNQLDTATGTARVRAQFRNASEALTPGAFVAVRLQTGLSPAAVVLPAAVVRPGIEGHFVYRVEKDVARRVPVTLGFTSDTQAVVTRGVNPGDVIVSDGYSRLRDGAAVSVTRRPAAAMPQKSAG